MYNSSYKIFQAKKKVSSILSMGVHAIVKRGSHDNATATDEVSELKLKFYC